MIELQNIPEKSKVKVETARGIEMITFHHCDGMYSYSTTIDGLVINLSRFTPLKKVDDYYIIDQEDRIEGLHKSEICA